MHLRKMRRREFVTLLCGAGMWPLVARAQQASLPVIGFMSSRMIEAFRRGLKEGGFIEGENVVDRVPLGAR